MKGRSNCLVCLGCTLLAGCAADRPGVLRHLPQPILPIERPQTTHMLTRLLPRPARIVPGRTLRQSWSPPNGVSNRWKCIVIHHSGSTGGNAEQFDQYHRNVKKWDELGYHFVIGNGSGAPDGQIEVGSRWIKQKHGAHCKTTDNYYNEHGIGICLVGDFNGAPPTPAQMASLTRLVTHLVKTCRISPADVLSHRGVTGHTVCPGKRFPLYSFQRAIADAAR